MTLPILLAATMTASAQPPAREATPPVLRNADAIVRPKDYPRDAMRREDQGPVRFEVTVSKKGRATGCRVTERSVSPSLDAQTCMLVLKRARFTPATDTRGKAIEGSYTRRIMWLLGQR